MPAAPERPAAGRLACPKCGDADFAERASFKAATEPLMGAPSSTVAVDVMSCKRCGYDLPTVRGKRKFVLVQDDKLAGIQSELEGERKRCSDFEREIDSMVHKVNRIQAEIERTAARGVVSAIEARVTALESENAKLEERKARLAAAIELISTRIPG